jgi:hypothetical protein
MKRFQSILVGIVALGLMVSSGCGTSRRTLTVGDIEPKLSMIPMEIGDEEGVVEYYRIGNRKFDSFFKSAAKLDGLTIIAEQMTRSATKQLKKYAMSKAADEAMKENIAELVGDTPPEDWTTDQSIAVMRMAKEQKKISTDEKKYFLTTAASLGVGTFALSKGLASAADVISQGTSLAKNPLSLKFSPWKIPGATKGVRTSLANLERAKKNGPETLEEMRILTTGFKMLGEDE